MVNAGKDESSRSSATLGVEQTLADHQHALPEHAAPKDVQNTEANVLPDTSAESKELDLEKAEAGVTPMKSPNPMDPSSFPDGGVEAWLVVSGGFACLFSSFGWINAIGVFQTYYENGPLSDYSPSTIAWIPSLEVFMMFAGGPIWGKVYDNHGPRYLILVGSFFNVFGLMMISISTKYWQFLLAQGICNPLGASMIFYPAMSSVTSWFFKRRAFAFGVVASGSSLGGVIFPIMVKRLIEEKGFGWALRAAGFLVLGLLVYANLTVKTRIPPMPRPWSVMEFIRPYEELPFFLTVFAAFLFFLGMFLPFTFVILSAQYHGMSATLAGYLLSILNAASIFGRTLPGFAADKLGRYNAMVVTSLLSTILVLGLWLPARGNAPYIVFAALFGFSSGAFVSLAPALVAQISDVRQIGVRTGSMFAVISVAALVGNPIGGVLISEENGSYTHVQIFCGVVMLAGSCCFIAARASLAGFKLKRV